MSRCSLPLPRAAFALGFVALVPSTLLASVSASAPPVCFAHWLGDLVGDRTKMIQASAVFVALCIALLWWKK